DTVILPLLHQTTGLVFAKEHRIVPGRHELTEPFAGNGDGDADRAGIRIDRESPPRGTPDREAGRDDCQKTEFLHVGGLLLSESGQCPKPRRTITQRVCEVSRKREVPQATFGCGQMRRRVNAFRTCLFGRSRLDVLMTHCIRKSNGCPGAGEPDSFSGCDAYTAQGLSLRYPERHVETKRLEK